MVNGKQGDNPVTDIVHYGLPVFTPEVDALVREVYELGGLQDDQSQIYLLHVSADVDRLRRQGTDDVGDSEYVRQLKDWLLQERGRLY